MTTVEQKLLPGKALNVEAKQVLVSGGVTLFVPYSSVKHLVANSPKLKRPNRTIPVAEIDGNLRAELDAWNAASDEVWPDDEVSGSDK